MVSRYYQFVMVFMLFTFSCIAVLYVFLELVSVSYGFANFPYIELKPNEAANQALQNILRWSLPLFSALAMASFLLFKWVYGVKMALRITLWGMLAILITCTLFLYNSHRNFMKQEFLKSEIFINKTFNK